MSERYSQQAYFGLSEYLHEDRERDRQQLEDERREEMESHSDEWLSPAEVEARETHWITHPPMSDRKLAEAHAASEARGAELTAAARRSHEAAADEKRRRKAA